MHDYLRLGEAAALVDKPRTTLADAVARGELPFVELAGIKLFRTDDLIAWSEQRPDGRTCAPAGKPREAAVAE